MDGLVSGLLSPVSTRVAFRPQLVFGHCGLKHRVVPSIQSLVSVLSSAVSSFWFLVSSLVFIVQSLVSDFYPLFFVVVENILSIILKVLLNSQV